MEKIIVIVGPTAVGKTALSIQLAQLFNGEIVSGDSMQIYKKLDIGTAKVTQKEAQGIPHYLIDEYKWDEKYSAYHFKERAEQVIATIHQKKKLPIIVGGTGMYIQALLENYTLGTGNPSFSFDKKKDLYEQFKQKEPKLAKTTHIHNTRRILRSLQRGENEKNKAKRYEALIIGLNTDRKQLHERINQRVDQMVKQGLMKEAQELYTFHLNHPNENYTVLQAIGYKECFPYFEGTQTKDEVIERVKRNSRRYAKRQITWFKNRMNVSFYDLVQHPEQIATIKIQVEQFLNDDK